MSQMDCFLESILKINNENNPISCDSSFSAIIYPTDSMKGKHRTRCILTTY